MKSAIKKILFANKRIAELSYTLLYSYRRFRDIAILDYFSGKPINKVYLDIGANDPILLSNSYLLYRNGWRGVTVEPIAALAALHRRCRPNDVCLNAGIGPVDTEQEFFETIPHVYSSFDEASVRGFVSSGLAVVKGESKIPIISFERLLAENSFLSECSLLLLDTEGYDETILKLIPWSSFTPAMVVSEQGEGTPVSDFLVSRGYRIYKTTSTNTLFVR